MEESNMVRLKATTRFKAMSYFEQVVNEAKYDMNCYEEGTPEYEKEKDRYEALYALYWSLQPVAEDKEL